MNGVLEPLRWLVPDWKDLLEIGIVTAVLYRVLLVFVGTRAIQMLAGLVLLVGAYFMSRLLELQLLQSLLEAVFQFGVIAALVVFQPELRGALARLGQSRLLRASSPLEKNEVAEEIAQVAEELARDRIGAIIAVEQTVSLSEYIEKDGTPLDARVSAALLATIFSPYSPLHDGAAIIRGDSLVGAGVVLPLTQYTPADRSLGTRHRAALGLSEETDALVLVISEETSTISVAHRGHLQRGLDAEHLATLLAGRTGSPLAS